MPGYEQVEYKSIEDRTYVLKEAMWFDSFARNLPWIREGRNVRDLMGRCSGPAVVVGAGPSVAAFGHLKVLAERGRGHVLATDRMLLPCISSRVVPELSVTVDGSPEIVKFYEGPFATSVDAALPVFAHQPLASLVSGTVYWYVPALDDHWEDPQKSPRSVTRAMVEMSKHSMAGSAYGQSGGFAWSLAEFMGHDPIILVGLDFSYGPGVSPVETTYWKGLLAKHGGKRAETLKDEYHYEDNPFGHRVLYDTIWAGYRDIFLKGSVRSRGTTINASPYSIIHGPGVTTMPLEDAIRQYLS